MGKYFRKHFNNLTPEEDERLALLAEECSEVIKAVCKIQRHGYESTNPDVENSPTNRQALESELGDLEFAMLLISGADVSAGQISLCKQQKARRIRQYLHHTSI